eukprot:16430721-Heterocapsa_arctica.AAC.1
MEQSMTSITYGRVPNKGAQRHAIGAFGTWPAKAMRKRTTKTTTAPPPAAPQRPPVPGVVIFVVRFGRP